MLGFLKKVLPGSGATPDNAAPAAARPSSSVLSAFPPSESSVRKAIVSVRHARWYRAEHEGGCPKNACSSLFSFDSVSAPERASLKDIQACISRKTDICPAEKEEEEEGEDVKSPRKDAASRLCELHRRQATWRNWGTTCDDYYCHGHEWPSEKDAPLLYLKFTSPRQAVLLLHFGLLKESHVDRLVTENFRVAVFVAHLMHNSGVPDNSAMELLVQLSRSTSTCLPGIWEDSSSSLSSVSKLVDDHDGDATPKKAVRRSIINDAQKNPSVRGKRRISDSPKQEVWGVIEHEASNDDNTESNPPEPVPSPVGGRDPKIKSKLRSSAKVTGITEKEDHEDDKVRPTHQDAVSRKRGYQASVKE